MEKKIFSGVATAIITPFSEHGVDYGSFERLIELQIEAGVDALVFCGTTGEAPTLDIDEKKKIFAFAKSTVGKRVPVIFGTSTNDHKMTMRLSEYAAELCADALLCVTPYYNKGTDEGIIYSYREVCSLGVPVMLYNVPSRSNVDIKENMLARLSYESNICAVKECAGVNRISENKCTFGDRYAIYSGNDAELLPSLSVGADGIVSVLSNIYPGKVCALYKAFLSGDMKSALALHRELHEICSLLFAETNPAPVKYCLAAKGLCENILRLPMGRAGEELCKKLDKEMKKIEQNI